MPGKPTLAVGHELFGPVRAVTAERIEWYDSAMISCCMGELRQVGTNIHTDAGFAQAQGFRLPNADGMMSANWCSQMLIAQFGLDYCEHGELRTKFIKPAELGKNVHVRGRVIEATPTPAGGMLYSLDIWCEDDAGTKLVDGDARVEVSP
jgi:acyl dehydratase